MTELSCKVISINSKKTSIRLTTAEWEALDNICEIENIKRSKLLELLNNKKDKRIGLTCSVRLFSVIYFYRLLLKKQQNYTTTKQIESPLFDAINGIL